MALKGLSAPLTVSSASSHLEDVVIFWIFELARAVSILNMADCLDLSLTCWEETIPLTLGTLKPFKLPTL